jgi:hypothetical protein
MAACASNGVSPRTALAPRSGPGAHIYASVDGGLTNRTLRASFKVDRYAYVMVGHLAGDGRIGILYPVNAMTSARVRGNKSYAVGPVSAPYDGVPGLFSYASRTYRSTGARKDSYDGLGNGFVFIIASDSPLDADGLSTDGFWDDYEVTDYASSPDPRYAIRDFAQYVTRGLPYTLDYADTFGTNAFTSFANMQMDCSMWSNTMGLWGAGGAFIPSVGWWNGGALMTSSWYFLREPMLFSNIYSSFNAGCGGRRSYAFGYGIPSWDSRRAGRNTATPAVPTTPAAPLAPRWSGHAPGLRQGSESGAAVSLTRPRFGGSQPTSPTTASWDPPAPRQSEPEHFRPSRPTSGSPRASYDPPSRAPRNESPSSSSGRYDAPRTAPVNQAPRFSPPSTPAAAPASPASPPPRVEARDKPLEP